ncbi:hypothetical protein BSNK01_11820 [Bacillaceae bacterium]
MNKPEQQKEVVLLPQVILLEAVQLAEEPELVEERLAVTINKGLKYRLMHPMAR